MARSIVYVPTANPQKNGNGAIDLENIPAEVKAEVEEMYAAMKANPNGRFRITFDTKADLNTYLAQANAYAAQRPDLVTVTAEDGTETTIVGGPIRIRRSPSKGLADNVMDLRVTDLKTEAELKAEADAKAIREAAAAAGGTPVETPAPAKATPAKAAKGKAA